MAAYEVQRHILFRAKTHEKLLRLEDLVTKIASASSFDVRVSGLFVYVREEPPTDPQRQRIAADLSSPAVRLSIAHGPDVLADAVRIAELHAADRSDRPLIAACDARIEISWKVDDSDDVMDIVVALEPELEEYASGVIWSANVKELSEGSFAS